MELSGLEKLRRPRPRAPEPGDMLVAAPSLLDPNFRRALVFLLQHDDDGSAGVVVNRPSEYDVRDMELPDWAASAVVLSGGPVASDSVLALADVTRVPEELRGPSGAGICLLDLDVQAEVEPIEGLRIFVGHAGWSQGQLMAEIARDDWHVVSAGPGDVLLGDPATAWARVLRRQRDHTRLWATMPALPAAN